jgi:hypothetical protein
VLGLEIHERAHVFAVEVPGSEVSLVPPRRYVFCVFKLPTSISLSSRLAGCSRRNSTF